MPRQLGPKGRSDLRTSLPHWNHAERSPLPLIAIGHSQGCLKGFDNWVTSNKAAVPDSRVAGLRIAFVSRTDVLF